MRRRANGRRPASAPLRVVAEQDDEGGHSPAAQQQAAARHFRQLREDQARYSVAVYAAQRGLARGGEPLGLLAGLLRVVRATLVAVDRAMQAGVRALSPEMAAALVLRSGPADAATRAALALLVRAALEQIGDDAAALAATLDGGGLASCHPVISAFIVAVPARALEAVFTPAAAAIRGDSPPYDLPAHSPA